MHESPQEGFMRASLIASLLLASLPAAAGPVTVTIGGVADPTWTRITGGETMRPRDVSTGQSTGKSTTADLNLMGASAQVTVTAGALQGTVVSGDMDWMLTGGAGKARQPRSSWL